MAMESLSLCIRLLVNKFDIPKNLDGRRPHLSSSTLSHIPESGSKLRTSVPLSQVYRILGDIGQLVILSAIDCAMGILQAGVRLLCQSDFAVSILLGDKRQVTEANGTQRAVFRRKLMTENQATLMSLPS